MTGREVAEMPPGVTDISEVYDLVRDYLDGTGDDLRAYEALDYLYVHARSWLRGSPWPYAAPR